MVSLLRLRQCGTLQIDEDGLFELVRTKPGDKTSYEPLSMHKKTKKENADPVESLSQRKDQSEGDLSQLSERSVSSPTTQTLSSSPALKGGCFKLLQQLAQEHNFTVNLIHTSAVCLKFPHQWASYMCYAVIILSEYNLSWVHPGAFVQLTDDINTFFLIPTFRDTFF